jgi:hypothetical protein
MIKEKTMRKILFVVLAGLMLYPVMGRPDDIHISESPYNKAKRLIKVRAYYHVPNDKVNNSYPGLVEALDNAGTSIPVSTAPGVTGDELNAMKDGSLYEVIITKFYNLNDGQLAIKNAVRAKWQDIADKKQTELDKNYPFYGVTLDKAVE